PDQDTVNDPYDGNPPQGRQWLADYLYHRFYRLPEGIQVTLLKGTNKLNGNRQFEPVTKRTERKFFERSETVGTRDGIKIHYVYDAPLPGTGHNKSSSGAMMSDVSTGAIVCKDEMYDLRKSKKWQVDAPIFGIPFGSKHISVHVELPDDYQV